MMKKYLSLLFFIFPYFLGAQTLTADDALQIALKNNFDILVSKNQSASDSILDSRGEAGMLPTLSLNGGVGLNQNNIHQKYANGNDFIAHNAGGNNVNSGIALSWTLFDGSKMFVTKQKLDQINILGEYQFKTQVLNTTYDVLLSYYDIVKQKQQLAATNEILKYNEQRVTITQNRFDSGLGPKTDLLQAMIDMNVQKENLVNETMALDQSKRKLNSYLARDVNTPYEVIDSIPLSPLTDRTALEQKMYAANPTLLAFKTQIEISKLSMRETRSQYFPKVALNAGYNFNRNENTAGFSLYNQAYGWQTGLTFSIPLYQGGKTNRQVEVAQLDIESSEFQLQQASVEASLELQNAFSVYDAQTKNLGFEKENKTMAEENMQLALERLRLGKGTALEVAQAQSTLSSTLFRLTGIEYEVKSAEINVHRQAADL
jgi:outer membrane protein TolC